MNPEIVAALGITPIPLADVFMEDIKPENYKEVQKDYEKKFIDNAVGVHIAVDRRNELEAEFNALDEDTQSKSLEFIKMKKADPENKDSPQNDINRGVGLLQAIESLNAQAADAAMRAEKILKVIKLLNV